MERVMEIGRYSRQVLFQPIGVEGQLLLRKARVAIVGMGALGTALSSQLVRAGVGFVRLIDRDIIEPSNLQRQSLYDEADAEQGRAKAEVAAEKLRAANREVEIEIAIEDVNSQNAERLLADVDVIVDGTDNFEVRYLINDVAVKHNIPWSYGGAVSSYGTTAFFRPGHTPCLVCLFGPNTSGGGHDTCDTVGVIAPVVSIVASYQVAETLKYLTGNSDSLANSVTYLDVWKNEFRSVKFGVSKEACPCCQKRQFTSLTGRANGLTVSFCGRRTIQVRPSTGLGVSLPKMAQQLANFGEVRHNPDLLRCDFGDKQITLFADGRALIHGVDDEMTARSLYARYIGM
ncbi:ThiF family adenylyltransferase [Alicyclobacillus fastidiosus]|uniref:ThiF family adenylyltransferase n=1 Tax=Alicyclobacillus fastidiosus TaxID=392011 RepID=A0ABY6ZCW2_9BACL|nr:ThiF family adenylyltransferase [Alicyclobacillus fastidiosus]WAH40677.1 ThiF family adenylyltransferase [Alicyclobacillus fastidiosus]GMA62141.1 thiamine/molybdopterin biosynthesis protein MoeB [Alicyclobacillus fastidiosus]